MRGASAWTLGAASLAALSVGMSDASGTRGHNFLIGHKGWSLERFGDDIAILRAEISTSSNSAGSTGLLLVSCQGPERRLRLSLPESIGGTPPNAVGNILIDTYGGPAESRPFVLARTSIIQRRHLNLSNLDDPASGAVEKFVRLLQSAPMKIQILMMIENAPRTLSSHYSYTFSVKFTRAERLAIDQMVAACSK